MTTFLVNLLAFGTLLSSVFTITSKNPVISVIFLISTFVQAALYLILIGINFIGISYIVIYVGAIAVLFLFVIMMINIKLTDILETGSQYTKNLPLAISIGSLFIYIFFTNLPYNFNNVPAISTLLDFFISLTNIFSHSNEFINNFNLISINSLSLGNFSEILISSFTQIEVIAFALYNYEAVLLIVLSMILLLAMLAAIVISRD